MLVEIEADVVSGVGYHSGGDGKWGLGAVAGVAGISEPGVLEQLHPGDLEDGEAGDVLLNDKDRQAVTQLVGEGHEAIDECPAVDMGAYEISREAEAGDQEDAAAAT